MPDNLSDDIQSTQYSNKINHNYSEKQTKDCGFSQYSRREFAVFRKRESLGKNMALPLLRTEGGFTRKGAKNDEHKTAFAIFWYSWRVNSPDNGGNVGDTKYWMTKGARPPRRRSNHGSISATKRHKKTADVFYYSTVSGTPDGNRTHN